MIVLVSVDMILFFVFSSCVEEARQNVKGESMKVEMNLKEKDDTKNRPFVGVRTRCHGDGLLLPNCCQSIVLPSKYL